MIQSPKKDSYENIQIPFEIKRFNIYTHYTNLKITLVLFESSHAQCKNC